MDLYKCHLFCLLGYQHSSTLIFIFLSPGYHSHLSLIVLERWGYVHATITTTLHRMSTGLLAEILICVGNAIHLEDHERLNSTCCWLLYLMEKGLILEICRYEKSFIKSLGGRGMDFEGLNFAVPIYIIQLQLWTHHTSICTLFPSPYPL